MTRQSPRTPQRRTGSNLAFTGLALLLLAACAPVQSRPGYRSAVGIRMPAEKARDVGLVGAAPDDATRYRTIAIGNVSVDAPGTGSAEDRRIASSVVMHLRADLVRRLGAAGRFERVTEEAGATPASENVFRLDIRITQLELDRFAPTELGGWVGPGSIEMEASFVDVGSGRVVQATAHRRTARQQTTQTRDIPGTTALLNETVDFLANDLVDFLRRSTTLSTAVRPADSDLVHGKEGCQEWKTGRSSSRRC